ncbi:hypothetical protein LCGC14_2214300 [marine sediment metagenome]|uniref:Uncharacterized protein n=1 Tax=marine sediment metagenome TaxID=412755 RepID=A0A0F9FQF2_9ZZZZ
MCKKWCREKYGDMGAEQIPPMGGMIFFNEDGTGTTRLAQREYDDLAHKRGKSPVCSKGPRPQGWLEALGRMSERAAVIIGTGLKVPEC